MTSVLLVTLAIAVLTAPLNAFAFRTQVRHARMRPQLEELRRRHAEHPERLAKEVRALFRAHGLSPAGGILIAAIQAPVLIAMYRWVRDLAARSAGLHWLGVDVSQVGTAALHAGPASALLLIGAIAVVAAATLIQARATETAGGGHTGRKFQFVAPVLGAGFALVLPLAVTVYYAASGVLRAGQYWVFARRLGA